MGSIQQSVGVDSSVVDLSQHQQHQQIKSTVSSSSKSSKYDLTPMFRLSVINIILFPISAALEGLWTIYGHGIWCGIFYLVTGYLGFIVSCKRPCRPTKPLFIATTVFASLSIVFSVIAFALSLISCLVHCHRDYIYNSSSIGLATVSFVAFIVNVAITAVISIRGIPSSDATTDDDDDEIINDYPDDDTEVTVIEQIPSPRATSGSYGDVIIGYTFILQQQHQSESIKKQSIISDATTTNDASSQEINQPIKK